MAGTGDLVSFPLGGVRAGNEDRCTGVLGKVFGAYFVLGIEQAH